MSRRCSATARGYDGPGGETRGAAASGEAQPGPGLRPLGYDAGMPRVRLVPLRVDHLPHVMTWVNDREVMQYFALRQERIEEAEERGYLEKLTASSTDRAYSVFLDDGSPEAEAYVGQVSPASTISLFQVCTGWYGRNLGTVGSRASGSGASRLFAWCSCRRIAMNGSFMAIIMASVPGAAICCGSHMQARPELNVAPCVVHHHES